MAYPRHRASRTHKKARRTSGAVIMNSVNWANVDTGLDITLAGQVGDEVEYGVSGVTSNEAVIARLDVVTIVSAAPVNSFGIGGPVETAPGTEGIMAWYLPASVFATPGGAALYTLVSGDLASGLVTLRLRYSTATATNRTLYATTTLPLCVYAKNLGPVDPN